jgi:hypothetical protein
MKRQLSAAFLCATLAACGAGGAGDDGDDAADAGVSTCSVTVDVTPTMPMAGEVLVASAQVNPGGHIGLVAITWSVDGPAGAVTATPRNPDATQVDVPTTDPGQYTISAEATVGGSACDTGVAVINVQAPGANMRTYRLRYTPLPGDLVPPQDDATVFTLLGGVSAMNAGTRVLDPGQTIAAQVVGPAGGLGAELRLSPQGGGRGLTLYADSTGAYAGRVLAGTSYDLVIVPYASAVAPEPFPMQPSAALDSGYTLSTGDVVVGTVRGPGGAPLAGVAVSVSNGLPPTVSITDAGGNFSAPARGIFGTVAILAVPPADSGLARLSVSPAAGIDATTCCTELTLSSTPTVTLSIDATTSDGAAAPGARVTFVAADVGGVQAVHGGIARPATAPVRASFIADGTGHVSATLPQGSYQVVIEPPPSAAGERLALAALDLSTQPAGTLTLASAAAATTMLLVRDEDGQPITGARIVAVSPGALGIGAGDASSSVTDDVQGAATLQLTPGLLHEITVEGPVGAPFARLRTLSAGGGAAITLTLEPGIRVVGNVTVSGLGLPRVRVAAHCIAGCGPGEGPDVASAETNSETGGRFELVLPDPGVSR